MNKNVPFLVFGQTHQAKNTDIEQTIIFPNDILRTHKPARIVDGMRYYARMLLWRSPHITFSSVDRHFRMAHMATTFSHFRVGNFLTIHLCFTVHTYDDCAPVFHFERHHQRITERVIRARNSVSIARTDRVDDILSKNTHRVRGCCCLFWLNSEKSSIHSFNANIITFILTSFVC